jgi:uncharacterized protein (DUF2237 family)
MTNVFGKELKICGLNPITGYMRNGYCQTNENDYGTHIVCSIVTEDFLKFTYKQGNT